ncbi:MAG: SurA N-terminal domain-containing protein [Rhodobacter sp.]|uniref:peptidylprolyl isomerase n=1 Tax=Pararhodobacter sp. TaxID=2127056 RepID=UPI002BD9E8C6|nr:peptidylprolyl isomerase [Pararhodobacter sp.]MCC0074157.1 SurA N-terminal domain-containing protein [Rhodobacter sp.]HPD92953.1 SurA N-terminal domain-containing protein [Pararhodobacter sp.]
MKAVLVMLATALLSAIAAPAARAQSPFAAAVYVNDSAITNYEVTQKMRLLEFLGATGSDPRQQAIDRLIEERLQEQEATRLGGRLEPGDLTDAMTEFAGRANLTLDAFVARLQQAGIDRDTFVSFIRAGALWRGLVQARFGSQIRITDAQIDQALSVEGVQPVTEVLISEIFLPTDAQFAETVQRIVPQIQRIRSETEFANAARQVSIAPSATTGGRVDRWINVAAIPDPVGSQMATAPIGAVVGPVDMPGALAFFLLRARRDSRAVAGSAIEIDYRRVALPGGRSDETLAHVARIRDAVDSCADFAPVVLREFPDLAQDAIATLARPATELSAAERTEIERLNPGEMSANTVTDGRLVLLMLCARRVTGDGVPTRDQARLALLNRALEGQATVYLQQLRADADIRYP